MAASLAGHAGRERRQGFDGLISEAWSDQRPICDGMEEKR